MAQSISAKEYLEVTNQTAGDFNGDVKPVSVHDFMIHADGHDDRQMPRRTLSNDAHSAAPQSQVDRLISDLMDIIVKAAAVNGNVPQPEPTEAVAEVVALSMMQALLQKQVCSSF